MVTVNEITASSILTPQRNGSLSSGYDFTINPYLGCGFACSYCYVPKFPNARHSLPEWGGWLEVKMNAADLIQKDRTRIFGSRIFFGSATDPYQYAELEYGITRQCLEMLVKYPPKRLTIHTRSHLMIRDIELLKQFGDTLSVGVSITTDSDAIRQEFEPQAPSIYRRLELLKALKNAGVNAFASLAPLLPTNADRLIELISPYVSRVLIDEARWPEVNRSPELLDKYADFFEHESYQATMQKIARAFPQKRSSHRAIAAPPSSHTHHGGSAHGSHKEPLQLKLSLSA
ncbi:MAG: radical SAM protein [Leptolyngbya sp.]|nr:radical SAM protein [Candidatus Melainabacteria bacterium]